MRRNVSARISLSELFSWNGSYTFIWIFWKLYCYFNMSHFKKKILPWLIGLTSFVNNVVGHTMAASSYIHVFSIFLTPVLPPKQHTFQAIGLFNTYTVSVADWRFAHWRLITVSIKIVRAWFRISVDRQPLSLTTVLLLFYYFQFCTYCLTRPVRCCRVSAYRT